MFHGPRSRLRDHIRDASGAALGQSIYYALGTGLTQAVTQGAVDLFRASPESLGA